MKSSRANLQQKVLDSKMLNLSNNNIPDSVKESSNAYLQELVNTPKGAHVLKRWLLGFFIIFIITLFLPWQQNINGKGYVTALNPAERPQDIQNVIAGRIEQWNVVEGQLVRKGDTLVILSELKDEYFDPQLPTRLNEQLQAKKEALSSYQAKSDALQKQIEALSNNWQLSLEKARNKVKQNRAKVSADSSDVIAEQLQVKIAQDRLQRGLTQEKQGILSLNEIETRRLKFQETQNKLISVQNKLAISKQELINSQIELNSVNAEYAEKIAKARSDRSSALASIADGQSELSKLVNKQASVDIRRGLYVVRAPQDGYVVKAMKTGIGETLKETESICTLQPVNPNLAVELYVNAMDVPLIQQGRIARLEFEGWPAIQFSGWPSVSVGTFAGKVKVIDMVNSKNGQYRLLVTSDGGNWPKQLRVGSGVYGWIMLDDVPVWYELWRQLNAFPPSLKEAPEDETKDKDTSEKK
ncbi:secretion protein HlyD [Emticicia oligotrophica DSM 17448]|uniref:Secretion protein HlyD n=2 Tax=Emticicia TaxID=312278 RepID=A0ABM5N1I3_EMTOG|nr:MULTISPECIES: biotin/lipoyl-binding protein [Emticicia]AFK03246.1 secretion protein HlyD [Emticicia oligotrophica DSM 17448]